MAITLVTSASGSGSNNSSTPALSGIQAGDLVLLACTGGDKSNGIPNTSGEAPAQGNGSGGISASTDFTLQVQTNAEPARLAIWSRYWTGTDTQVHLGSGWSGQGNHYVLIVLRGVDDAAGSIVAGSITGPNTALAISEPSPGAGWTEYGYAAFWSHERNSTFSSPVPTGFAIAQQISANKGSACVSYDLDLTSAVTNISISNNQSGKESSEAALVFKIGATSTNETRSFDDGSTGADSLQLAVEANYSDATSASDSIKVDVAYGYSDEATVADSSSLEKSKTSDPSDSSTTEDSLKKDLSLELSDSATTSDTQKVDVSVGLSDASTTTDSVVFGFEQGPSDSTTVSDSLTLAIEAHYSDTATNSDALELGFGLEFSDAVTAADSDEVGESETPADSVDAEDAIDPVKGYVEEPSDASTASDSYKVDVSYGLEDSVDASDAVDPQTTGAEEATPSDSSTTEDSIQVALVLDKSDSLSSTDALERVVEKSPSDSVSGEDSISKAVSISLSDSVQTEDQQDVSGSEEVTPSDSSTTEDSLQLALVLDKSDTLSSSDAVSIEVGRDIADSVSVQDSTANDISVFLEDSVSVSDSKSVEISVSYSDATSTEDSQSDSKVPGGGGANQTTDPSDSGTVSDQLAREFSVQIDDALVTVSGIDNQGATDDFTLSISLGYSDSVSASDLEEDAYGVSLSDAVTVADSESRNIEVFISDSALVSESESSTSVQTRTFADSTLVSDSADVGVGVAFSDSASASDSKSPAKEKIRNLEDSVTVTESQKLDILMGLLEQASANDAISVAITLTQADSASSSDTLSASRVVFDNVSASDALTAALSIGLTVDDIVGVGAIEGFSPPELLTIGEALALIDIYNTALNALGVGTITAVTDTSPQATILNDVWPGFRKQFLTDHSWNGAKKSVALSRLQDYQGTDVTPAGDRWDYAYVLPDDYLRVLRINGYERYNATQRHLQNAFEIMVVNYSDSSSTTKDVRCLLTEETTVNLEYIFDPGNDDIDLLGAQTSHAVGLSLAHYVARNFGKTPQEIAVLAQEARVAVSAAKGSDGQENSSRLRPDMNIIESRYWWVG